MEEDSASESDQKPSNLKLSSVDEEAYESDINTKAEKEKNYQKRLRQRKRKGEEAQKEAEMSERKKAQQSQLAKAISCQEATANHKSENDNRDENLKDNRKARVILSDAEKEKKCETNTGQPKSDQREDQVSENRAELDITTEEGLTHTQGERKQQKSDQKDKQGEREQARQASDQKNENPSESTVESDVTVLLSTGDTKTQYHYNEKLRATRREKRGIPPSWVVKCLAPWIDSWCKNGRVRRDRQSKFDLPKTYVLDEDGISSDMVFEKFKKQVLTSATPQQEAQVACVLMTRIHERDINNLYSVIRQITATNMPFAILVRTYMTGKLKNDESSKDLSFVHVLRPFVLQEDESVEIRASWICGRLSIPDGEIMAAEDIFFKERLSERNAHFSATERGIKKISAIETVNRLADKVLELRLQQESILVARVEAQKFEFPAIDLCKMDFLTLIDFSMRSSLVNPKMAVRALKEAVTRNEMTVRVEEEKMAAACRTLILMDTPIVQREAAIILATYDIGRASEEWQNVLGDAIVALARIKEKDAATPLSKSLNFLIGKGVHAYPDSAAAAALHFCKQQSFNGEFPGHMAKQLEKWARKYVARGPAPKWHEILATLGAPGLPKIYQESEATATVHFGMSDVTGDPTSVMEYNANGLTARWKDHFAEKVLTNLKGQQTNEKAHDPKQLSHNPQSEAISQAHSTPKSPEMLPEHDSVCAADVLVEPCKSSEKRKMTLKKPWNKKNKQKVKADVFERGDLRRVIQQTGSPDVVAILEAKIDVQKLLSLPGFQDWCREQRYNHVIMSWSSNESRGGKGYAGIVVLSRVAPVKVVFGMPALVNGEARSITLEFETFNLLAVYSPCTGYNSQKIKERAHFDDILKSYIGKLYRTSKKPIILAGDLNVNPRAQDYHKSAFAHMARLKKQSGLEYDPGCSPQEIDAYYNTIARFDGVNVWEKLRQYDPYGMTWHPKFNSGTLNHFLIGQRLDHFVASK